MAKKITGTSLQATVSVTVTSENLQDSDQIRKCPAIYQEIIRSHRHLRVNCFGSSIHATLIESDVFDWRRKLQGVPFTPFELSRSVKDKLVRLLQLANLEMGIMDMIISENHEEPVWLELNPQGQFLFCEALSGEDLTSKFGDFLVSRLVENRPNVTTALV